MNSVNLIGVLAADPRPTPPTEHSNSTVAARLCVTEQGKSGATFRQYIPIEAFGVAAQLLEPLQ